MEAIIDSAVEQYERGHLSRRQFVGYLAGVMGAAMSGANAANASAAQSDVQADALAASGNPFQATGLNHIALRVTDVPRSREFYKALLGLEVSRDGGQQNCFLTCGDHFVALFRNQQAGMDHYCYSVADYDVNVAKEKLEQEGLEPRTPAGTGRIYFEDPDGLTVQLAGINHRP